MKRSTALAALALPFVPRAAYAQNRTPRKLGLTAALTGPLAAISVEFIAAYQLAVQHVNDAGGLKGRPVQLLVEDSKATPVDGIAAMRKLVQVDGIEALITFLTGVSTAQMPLADQLRLPTIAGIETPGIVDNATYMFACGVRQDKVVPLLVDYWRKHSVKKIYGFFPTGATGNALGPALVNMGKGIGADVTLALIGLGEPDYRGHAARVKDLNPDAIYIQTGSSTSTDSALVRQLREIGVNTPVYFGGNLYTVHTWREAMGPYSEGLVFSGANVDRKTEYGRTFIRDYRSKMGFEPGYNQGELYDGGRIIMHAMENATTGDEIRSNMATLKGLPSVLGGTLAMGPDHYTTIPAVGLWQVRRGVEVRID
jgi:branched-chain amino acid transport system substrate-binding protein